MDRKEKIDLEVKNTVQCFENKERLPFDDYFAARVLARLDREERSTGRYAILGLARYAIKPVIILLVVAFNIFTAMVYLNGSVDSSQDRSKLMSAFAEEIDQDHNQDIINFM